MRAKVLFVAALLVVCFTMTASAQVSWNVTSANLQVVVGGKAETVGAITLTNSSSVVQTTPTTGSTITFDYHYNWVNSEVASTFVGTVGTVVAPAATGGYYTIDITYTNGMVLTLRSTVAAGTDTAGIIAMASSFALTGSGTQVNIAVPASMNIHTADQITLDGVRLDISSLSVNYSISADISSIPSTSTYDPSSKVVATVLQSYTAELVNGVTGAVCTTTFSGSPIAIQVTEAFAGAFVQYTAVSGNRTYLRTPQAGANSNTQFTITLTGVPSSVTISWPATIVENSTSYATLGTFTLMDGVSTATTATYEFTAGSASDSTPESFVFKVYATNDTSSSIAGVATATIQFGPIHTTTATAIPRYVSAAYNLDLS